MMIIKIDADVFLIIELRVSAVPPGDQTEASLRFHQCTLL